MRHLEPYYEYSRDHSLDPSRLHGRGGFAADPWKPERSESQIRDYLMVLRHRWRLIAAFAAGAFLLMAVVSLLTRPLYTATAVVHVQHQPPHVTNIEQVVTPPSYFEGVQFFQDQVSFLESRSLAAAVVRALGLEHDDRFLDPEGRSGLFKRLARIPGRLYYAVQGWFSSGGAAERREENASDANPDVLGVPSGIVGKFQAGLEITPVTNSQLIRVSYTSHSPSLAQRIANTHVEQYIRRGLQEKFELTGEARRFLEAEIDRVQNELASAEEALNQFRREHQVISLDERENAVVERLTDLARRVTEAQAERISAEAEQRLVKSREYDSLPAVLSNALIQNLKAEVSRLEIRQAELAEIFLERSPQLQEVNSQLRQARARLDRELARTVGGIESVYLAARAREDALRGQLEQQQEQVLDLKEVSGQFIKLEQEVTTTRNLYGTLLQRKQETDVVRGVTLSNASVMDPAELPGEPSSPQVALNLAFGLLFGCALGVALALVLENVDSSLKSPDDVRKNLRLPTLGVVPDFAKLADATVPRARPARLLTAEPGAGRAITVPEGEILSLTRRQSVPAEAYRSIRTSILFLNPEHPMRTLLVTSSEPREGKTATTVNLAISLAQLGNRVVVVDADLRAPRCHRALGVPAGPGLAEVLRGQTALESVILSLNLDDGRITVGSDAAPTRLHLLQSGRPPGDPAELLSSPRMREVLGELSAQYDMVLIDSPPVFPITDSAILAPAVDGVVLVVRGHRTNRQITSEALERLHFMKAKVVGVVLNGVDPGSGHYKSYSYYFAA